MKLREWCFSFFKLTLPLSSPHYAGLFSPYQCRGKRIITFFLRSVYILIVFPVCIYIHIWISVCPYAWAHMYHTCIYTHMYILCVYVYRIMTLPLSFFLSISYPEISVSYRIGLLLDDFYFQEVGWLPVLPRQDVTLVVAVPAT